MVRDNRRLTASGSPSEVSSPVLDEREIREVRERALLYVETVAVLELLSDTTVIDHWRTQAPARLRDAINHMLPPMHGKVDVLVERLVLWLRPYRRAIRPTRIDPLDVPLDVVDTPAVIDSSASYPRWIQRNPQAVAEWDWTRNDADRNPWDPVGVSRTAAWVCDNGHSWEASPSTRGSALTRCPYCVGQMAWPGHTDLRSTYPDVAAEWDAEPGQNAGDPDRVSATSGRRINWLCAHGHGWSAPIHNRARHGTGCPYCAGRRPIPGETYLATSSPDIAAEWDYALNGDLTPILVTPGSTKKVWWTALCGHIWKAAIFRRTLRNGTGCWSAAMFSDCPQPECDDFYAANASGP
ncbi:zinc-ribbon domain-containing protein [Pseudoclavibacter helvolus]|uniref:zinc-ribbon domain-containing protein n=1 Tax=Pseudoclavibacter helvolus TaxID=255205 RepID=UPI0024ADCF76|nr:zinc-ribbon domain-containing protein [Pseudoclavibacter helvolus]